MKISKMKKAGISSLIFTAVLLLSTHAFAGGNDALTVLLMHFNDIDGSTNFEDSAYGSSGSHTVTAYGNVQIDTTQKKFGSGSALFDGTGDYLSLEDSDDWYLGTGDFTIDCWIKWNKIPSSVTASTQDILCQVKDFDNRTMFVVNLAGQMQFYDKFGGGVVGNYLTTSAISISVDTWYHLAVVRNDTSFIMFFNGASQSLIESTAISTNDLGDINEKLTIGSDATYNQDFNGWIDEFRISKGVPRWTANFTPPTNEYQINSESVVSEPASLSLLIPLVLGLAGILFIKSSKINHACHAENFLLS